MWLKREARRLFKTSAHSGNPEVAGLPQNEGRALDIEVGSLLAGETGCCDCLQPIADLSLLIMQGYGPSAGPGLITIEESGHDQAWNFPGELC
jgi:hypothetical protein